MNILLLFKMACDKHYFAGIEEILNSEEAVKRMDFLCAAEDSSDEINTIGRMTTHEYFPENILQHPNIDVVKLVTSSSWFLQNIPALALQSKLISLIDLYKKPCSAKTDCLENMAFFFRAYREKLDRKWVQALFEQEDDPEIKKVLAKALASVFSKNIPMQYLLFFGNKELIPGMKNEIQKKCLEVIFPEIAFS
jgi:hypothetical protein